ncbi:MULTISPECIES: LysR substrate-binding domain-containing protein [Bacteria]|uniref:LysR substrate-binding domain-containing protein n=1 Tax=Bacteria TaxID=2 RepID=UPI002447E0D3|nr:MULTISPECIES: LysR substrate-binding domain-containing protein [unclassified Agrobacterium]MDH0612697.1 LysR substrate-binding domain-containing protein [Agrobacterium sp. GD03872]MDH0694561.1 LysR substrate-binding domain-containing protein [Agrobacterium sp. GD03871]MDH1058041.1 LysR substrate-binding domain-containing protein [Agrobacterium sp. GD03992]MDH2209330.1 LysR substrate-binding domain-containing protein [Agrobacterium sp. GD03643]MDH2218821.1 LysR substrate-binding domain-conta
MRWGRKLGKDQPEGGFDHLRGIPLVSLRHAIVVAEVLNFHHAANVLGTTQSSVSTRIKGLEDALGILLFERRHRGVRLTDAGQHFIAGVSAGIAQLDHAVRTAGARIDGTEGHLAIGLHSSIAAGFLVDLRRRYRASYPMVEQSVLEGRSSETIAMVREGRLDVAFVIDGVHSPDCHSRALWCEPIMVALPKDHPLAQRESIAWFDLGDEIFLARHGGTGPQVFEHVVRRLSERQRSPCIRRCDVARDTLMGMVAAGDGITLTSEATTYVSFPGVVFRSIADETEPARFSAVWSPHNRNPALLNMLDLAAQMSRSARSL